MKQRLLDYLHPLPQVKISYQLAHQHSFFTGQRDFRGIVKCIFYVYFRINKILSCLRSLKSIPRASLKVWLIHYFDNLDIMLKFYIWVIGRNIFPWILVREYTAQCFFLFMFLIWLAIWIVIYNCCLPLVWRKKSLFPVECPENRHCNFLSLQ